MRSDHLSKHSKIHTKKTKRSTAPTNEESSKIKTENPPVDEHRQLDNIIDEDHMESLPKSTYSQELSILTNQPSQTANCANPVYASQKSPLPLFYSHQPNQATTLATHQYNNPNSVFYHFTNNVNNCTDNNNRPAIGAQNGTNEDSHNETTTSAYNEKYTYDNYHHHYPSGASQAQVYHIDYANGHNYT